MKNRPLSILIVAVLFIIVGLAGFISHVKDFYAAGVNTTEIVLVQLLRLLAVVSGVLLLFAYNAGRWLAVAWLLAHVVISALNSIEEMFVHIGLLVVIAVLLYIPVSSLYFRRKGK